MIEAPRCRRPDKKPFTSRARAKLEARRARGADGRLSVYQCECGMWHIGKSDAEERARLRYLRDA